MQDGTGIIEHLSGNDTASSVRSIRDAGCSEEGKKVRAAPHVVMGGLEAQYKSGTSPHLDVTLQAEGAHRLPQCSEPCPANDTQQHSSWREVTAIVPVAPPSLLQGRAFGCTERFWPPTASFGSCSSRGRWPGEEVTQMEPDLLSTGLATRSLAEAAALQ